MIHSETLKKTTFIVCNHGQKSWDKFALVVLFHTRQTNSHAWIQLHLLSPSPQPTYNVEHFSGVGGGGGGRNEFWKG